jgi:hypothetical protein
MLFVKTQEQVLKQKKIELEAKERYWQQRGGEIFQV